MSDVNVDLDRWVIEYRDVTKQLKRIGYPVKLLGVLARARNPMHSDSVGQELWGPNLDSHVYHQRLKATACNLRRLLKTFGHPLWSELAERVRSVDHYWSINWPKDD